MTPYHALEEIIKNKKKKNYFYQLFLDVNNVKISNWNLSYEQENIMTCIYKLIQLNNLYQDNELNDFYNKIISKHDQLYINLISVLYIITCLIIVIGGII